MIYMKGSTYRKWNNKILVIVFALAIMIAWALALLGSSIAMPVYSGIEKETYLMMTNMFGSGLVAVKEATIDGKTVLYDACDSRGADSYPSDKWEFIGKGLIHAIAGIKQTGTSEYWFFTRLGR